jgi:hypothetical protein
MAEEQVQESMAPETTSSNEVDALKAEREALLKKNYELIGKLKNAKTVPDGVDVQELLDFKAAAEQADLEKQGKYTEARQALEQQFREAAEEKDKRIAELEARVRELEILSPAATALRDVVHDPDMILNTQVVKEQIQRDADGTVVVVNGYERTPIADWAKSLPAWMQKQPKPQGSGAPAGRSTGGDVPPGVRNPFAKDTFNLTEQSRLYKTDRDMYDRLKAAAER